MGCAFFIFGGLFGIAAFFIWGFYSGGATGSAVWDLKGVLAVVILTGLAVALLAIAGFVWSRSGKD